MNVKENRELGHLWLNRYVQAGHKMSIQRYQRLMCWLLGDTYAQIADAEGTTAQAVAHSVRRDLKRVQAFALDVKKTVDNVNDKPIIESKED